MPHRPEGINPFDCLPAKAFSCQTGGGIPAYNARLGFEEVSLLSGYAVPSLGVGSPGLFNLTGLGRHYSDCDGAFDLSSRL
jgi:hypothetical protein